MEENISEAVAKDMILEYILKYPNDSISSIMLQNELFPEASLDEVNLLIKKIDQAEDSIAKIHISEITSYIRANGITNRFLSQGGYKKIELENEKTENERLHKDQIIWEKTLFDLKLTKLQVKTFWPIFFIALIGGGLSIYNFVIGLSPSTEMEIMQKDLKQLTSEIDVLKNQFFIKDSIPKPQSPSDTLPNP